jgi:phosphosulfolactate synthase
MREFLSLPNRTEKERDVGLTMVLDTGLSTRQIDDLLELGRDYLDYVKLGWGTSVVSLNIKNKIKKYQFENIKLSFGGTLFEVAFIQNRVQEFKKIMIDLGIDLVEISDGSIEMDTQQKLDLISEFSESFTVLSEVGSKNVDTIFAPSFWVKSIQSELDAGAWKVIAEGRESGKAGLYRDSSEVRTGLVDDIVDSVPVEKIIWEAPQKAQQVWFIQKFGTNVNLGNIAPSSLISVETIRLGLRGDTLLHFHG